MGSIPVGIGEYLRPVRASDSLVQIPHVDEVEGVLRQKSADVATVKALMYTDVFERPRKLSIINLKSATRGQIRSARVWVALFTSWEGPCNPQIGQYALHPNRGTRGMRHVYHPGCIGLRSIPTTSAVGCLSAMSMAQIPVPASRSAFGYESQDS